MPPKSRADTGASPEGPLFMLVEHGGGPAKLVPYVGPKTPKSKARVRATPKAQLAGTTSQRITPQAKAKPKPRPKAKAAAKRVSFALNVTPKNMDLMKAMSGPGDPEYLRRLFELKEQFIGKRALNSAGEVDVTPNIAEVRKSILDQTFREVIANLGEPSLASPPPRWNTGVPY